MATKVFQGGNADFTNTGNWVGGVAPTSTDTIHILTSSQDLTSGLDQTATGGNLDPAQVVIGGTYSGSIGTASAALKFDDITGRLVVDVNGGPSQIIHLEGNPSTLTIVRNTGSNTYACLLNGTHTTLYIFGGQSIRIGASCTVTTLYVVAEAGRPAPNVVIEAGATVTTLNASTGTILDYRTAPATVNLQGSARYSAKAVAAWTITALTVRGNAIAYLAGVGGTVTAGTTYDQGVITSQIEDTQSGYSVTYTAVTAVGGSVLTKDSDTLTAATAAGGFIPFIAAAGTATVISGKS